MSLNDLKDNLKEKLIDKKGHIDKTEELTKEKNSLEKKLNEKRLYFKNLYEDKMKNLITEDDFKFLREEYSKDVESYQNRIEEIDKLLEEQENAEDKKTDIESILKKYKHIDKLNKVIIDEFIEKIYIGNYDEENNTREIKIEWNLNL